MQIFELHFNPGAKEDLIFDSFCYEAENIFEKRVGNLYMAGLLKNALSQNSKFLDKIAKIIRERFYGFSAHSPEKALKESLRRVNEFLEEIARKGDVSWLGNLSFSVISLKEYELNFTKVGNIKILILRNGQIVDIDKSLELNGLEPYPLKIFSNIVSGKLAEDDKIVILTEEIFKLFSQNLLGEFAKLTPFDEKGLKKILKSREGELLKANGFCLIIRLTKEVPSAKPLIFKNEPEKFLISRVFSDFRNGALRLPAKILKNIYSLNILRKIKIKPPKSVKISSPIAKIKRVKIVPKITLPSLPSLPSFSSLRSFSLSKIKIKIKAFKKNFTLISGLFFLLLIGFLIFNYGRQEDIKSAQQILTEAEAKMTQAENLIILKNDDQANIILQEAWNMLSPQTKTGSPLKEEAILLQNSIEKSLAPLNKLETISDPELFFEFKTQETGLVPQKILLFGQDLYFFNQFSLGLYKLGLENKNGELFNASTNLKVGKAFGDSIIFFQKPTVLVFADGGWLEVNLQLPSPDFNFDYLSVFNGGLYFLDVATGEIIKYPYLGSFTWDAPQIWLKPSSKTANAKSMAIDGSIWILKNENQIDRYYGGKFQETLYLKIFPYPKDFSKIFIESAVPYIYILEPAQKRVIIWDKETKQIFKQFQSEKFNNLMDIAVGDYGRTIYLLNEFKVYKIEL